MKWITRERPKFDRIACPVARSIDESPEFLYVPDGDVTRPAAETGAIPYDVRGIELGRHGDECSIAALFNAKSKLDDAASNRLAPIVRAAVCNAPQLSGKAAGLPAISKGLSLNCPGHHEMPGQGMVMHDARYAWCADTSPKELAGLLGST